MGKSNVRKNPSTVALVDKYLPLRSADSFRFAAPVEKGRERERKREKERKERERERKRGDINHLSVHQWLHSAIRDSQQPTSPIGFLLLRLPPLPCAVLLVYKWADAHTCGDPRGRPA